MTEKAWKQAERTVARQLGGQRTPLSGSHSRHTSADGIGLDEYLEHKRRQDDIVHQALTQLGQKARRRDRSPMIIYDLVDDDGPRARWAAMWLDRYLALKHQHGDTPLAFEAATPIDHAPKPPWLVRHEVSKRLPHAQLVLDTIQAADNEGRPPLIVITRHRSPNRVALVPLEVRT